MPVPAKIIVIVTVVGAVGFLVRQVRELLRQKRNLKHWERGEPLEKTGDWD